MLKPAQTLLTSGLAILILAIQSLSQTTPAQKPTFEVASIKQAVFPSDGYFAGFSAGAGCYPLKPAISGNRATWSQANLCGLISGAYDVPDYAISGPNWITKPDRSFYFDIQATAPEASGLLTPERAREMLRTLLEDRFELKVHREMKELPIYALVVGKNGPKLTLNHQGLCATASKGGQSPGFVFGTGRMASCRPSIAMLQLAQRLSRETDRPVIDKTGIDGDHVFELRWAPDGAPSQTDALPSLFTAVQEQLGLKLEPTKAMTEVLIIDSVRRPSEN